MAKRIGISVDAHAITVRIETTTVRTREVRVGRTTRLQSERVNEVRRVAPTRNEESLRREFEVANRVWAPADIVFSLRSFTPEEIAIPGNAEEVDQDGFIFLAGKFPPKLGVSLLLVRSFRSRDLGGEAVESMGVCIVTSLGDTLFGRTLAHEFGHLLGLDHIPDNAPRSHYNLMYRALRADDQLTDRQIAQARGSNLVRRITN